MKVLIDGKEVKCNESIKVIHEDQIIGLGWEKVGEDTEEEVDIYGEVHIQCTNEGIIIDAVDEEGQVIKSAWQTVEDLIEITH